MRYNKCILAVLNTEIRKRCEKFYILKSYQRGTFLRV